MTWLALDIGGANIKVADGRSYCAIERFALWREPDRLSEVLRNAIANAPASDHLAATMTGELADCFATKEQGVRHIVTALESAADGRHTRVYQVNGRLVSSQVALRKPLLAAAANWHALARFAGRYTKAKSALLIDIGSTTTDIVPLVDGRPQTQAVTDTDRLLAGELAYTGVERSPVCAMLRYVHYRKQLCPVAQEVFATAWDAYLVLNSLPEEPDSVHTADGCPATREAARTRLARTICADATTFEMADAVAAAEVVRRQQTAQIAVAVAQVLGRLPDRPENVILSGRGEFLARRVLERLALAAPILSLSQELGPQLSRCAPAHALAMLAQEGNDE
jgi:probable H4MPT-linked C1 transfer pathway protein